MIAVHDRVAYSAGYIASTCRMVSLSDPAGRNPRHGFALGDIPHYRGVVIGFAPDWTDLAYVRWDHDPEVARPVHVGALCRTEDIWRDASRHEHSTERP